MMKNNFRLVVNETEEIVADAADWVTWNGSGLSAAHDDIEEGRSLVLDFKPMSMDMLMAIKDMNYDGLAKLRTKSAYNYLTEPVTEVIEVTKKYIKFKTESNTYELHIKANAPWVRSKSPFTT